MSSMSKEWSLPDLGRPTMYGAPFKDIVVPLLVVVDMLPRCPVAINEIAAYLPLEHIAHFGSAGKPFCSA